MPIYEYRCTSCGHQREFLQKLSDPPRTRCPQCSQDALEKMLTAAGFQLKGSGWYATDFKGSSKPAVKSESKSEASGSSSDTAPKASAPAANTNTNG